MIVEIESVPPFDAQEFAVHARPVAIVAADDAVVARSQRGLAAVRAVRADGPYVGHFPRPRLVAVSPAGQRAYRADVDARAALVALQVVPVVGSDLRKHAAVDHAQRAHSQPFTANAHAAEAQDAARRVEVHHRRKLLFRRVHLGFRVPAFARAVAEGHVLQFALAALVAHR